MDESPEIITLVDEAGEELVVELIDTIEVIYGGQTREYALLVPVGAQEGEDVDVIIMRFQDDSLVEIENDLEFRAIIRYMESIGITHED